MTTWVLECEELFVPMHWEHQAQLKLKHGIRNARLTFTLAFGGPAHRNELRKYSAMEYMVSHKKTSQYILVFSKEINTDSQ
jgi:hypothetical protein